MAFSLLMVPTAEAQSGYPGSGSSGYPGSTGWVAHPTADSGTVTSSTDGGSPVSSPYTGQPYVAAQPGPGHSASATLSGTVTYTWKWNGGSNHLPPTPATLYIKKHAWATADTQGDASGTASANTKDGLGGTGSVKGPPGFSGGNNETKTASVDGSGGTATVSDTFSSSASVSQPSSASQPGFCRAAGGFTAQIIDPPHPVNFHQDAAYDLGDGHLQFHYSWDSSIGVLGDLDLNHCQVYENVTYSNNSSGFVMPDPHTGLAYYYPPDPFAQRLPEPTQLAVAASLGAFQGDHTYGTGNKNNDFSTPYKGASFSGTQIYFYHSDDLAPGNFPLLMGPLTISRRVYQGTTPGTWFFDISKSGISSTLPLSL